MAYASPPFASRRLLAVFWCCVCIFWGNPTVAAEVRTARFDLPAGPADESLKLLARQSGREVLFPADAVKGVRTRAVKAEMAPEAALEAMLAGTVLVGIRDDETGALTVRRKGLLADEKKKMIAGSVTQRSRLQGDNLMNFRT